MQELRKIPHIRFLTYLFLLVIIILVAIIRHFAWQQFISLPGPLGLFNLVVCAVTLPTILCIATILVVISLTAVALTEDIFPALFLYAGLLVVFFLIPLPELPPTPEMKYFLEHRAEYQQAIGIIRTEPLIPCYSTSNLWFEPPPEIEHLSAEHCIGVWTDKNRGLMVQFYPLEDFYQYILYVENYEYKVRFYCGEANLLQEIEPHWYVCEETWN